MLESCTHDHSLPFSGSCGSWLSVAVEPHTYLFRVFLLSAEHGAIHWVFVETLGDWALNGCVRGDEGVTSILAALPSLWGHRWIDTWRFIFLIWVSIFLLLHFH